MDVIKVPGPDHPITLTMARARVRALFQGHEIADSENAILLKEADYRPVWYFPRADVAMDFFGRTDRDTHCPYKGHASYYTVRRDGVVAENAAWSYEDPYPAMAAIQGHIAFYPNVVEVHQTTDEASAGASPDAAILHTDSGAGFSQDAHWRPTTEEPT
jgi:uncharacterized protein (DUF427 family)